jgi:hypothetical protein
MSGELARLRRALEEAVLRRPGRTPPSLRQGVFARDALPDELRVLVTKVHDHAYRVTDEDVAALRARYDDDQLYEVIVCAAVGAAGVRLDAGLRALDAAEEARAAAQGR